MKTLRLALAVVCGLVGTSRALRADLAPVATYQFQGTFAADQAGPPALTLTDPLGTSLFTTDTLYGQTRQVFAFNGNSAPASQSGLTLNTTGLVASNQYSVELLMLFNERNGAWRRLVDVQNRQSDNGFYVDPGNNLDIYPVSGGGSAFSTGVYHDVVLTVGPTSPSSTVSAYLDGTFAFSTTTSVMDIANAQNPSNVMHLFLDNVIGGGQSEWSSGRIALFRVYNDVLSADQIARQAINPFDSLVPEPASWTLLGLGALGLAIRHRRRRGAAAA